MTPVAGGPLASEAAFIPGGRLFRPVDWIAFVLVSFVVMAVGYSGFVLMPTPALAIAFLIPATLGAAAPTAAGAAAVVSIAPANMRSQCVAIYYFILNAVGFFIGPSSVALLTDYYFRDESQLRYSMFIVALSVSIYGFSLLIYNLPHFRAAAREAKANAAAGG